MAKPNSASVSDDYVRRWLQDIPSKPESDLNTDTRHLKSSIRKPVESAIQAPESGGQASPYLRRKGLAKDRSNASAHISVLAIDTRVDNDGPKEQVSASSPSFELAADTHAEVSVLASPQFRNTAQEDPSKKYARRPRQKTKADKYEYKGNPVKKSPAKEATKRKRKRSKRNKTVATLIQEFRAPNVEQERLTLKAKAVPGIFGKGKASAVLETHGLPDLTFSEMKFLSKKRQIDHVQVDKQKQGRPAKKRDRSKEIVELFANPQDEAAGMCRPSSRKHQWQQPTSVVKWSESPAISSLAKLTRMTQLSLKARNMNEQQKQLKQAKLIHLPNNQSPTDSLKYSNKHYGHEPPVAKSTIKPAENMATSCSWSVTPSEPGSKEQAANMPADPKLLPTQSAHQPRNTPSFEGTVSNSSLDRFTKHLLLNTDHDDRRQPHRAPLGKDVFSLNDLKGLARIAEIEERYSGLPDMISPQKTAFEPRHWLQHPTPMSSVQQHDRPGHVYDAHFDLNQEWSYNEHKVHDTRRPQNYLPFLFDTISSLDVGATDEQPDQELYDEEPHFHQGIEMEVLEPARSMLPALGCTDVGECHSDNLELRNDIPELRGFQYRENMEHLIDSYVPRSESQSSACNYGQHNVRLEDSMQHWGEPNASVDGRKRTSTWNEQPNLHVFESPAEEFQGFSRPQILY